MVATLMILIHYNCRLYLFLTGNLENIHQINEYGCDMKTIWSSVFVTSTSCSKYLKSSEGKKKKAIWWWYDANRFFFIFIYKYKYYFACSAFHILYVMRKKKRTNYAIITMIMSYQITSLSLISAWSWIMQIENGRKGKNKNKYQND